MLIHLIAAARPNFMKIAPLYHALKKEPWAQPVIVHTGQHYDLNMSDVFFQDLGLPEPEIHLGVGSGSHAEQAGQVMMAYENILLESRPGLVIVVGDVNSTMACTIAAVKIPEDRAQKSKNNKTGRPIVAHLEAGLRSYDRTMPEEINRLVTDTLADILWTPSPDGDKNLMQEGVARTKIQRVGNIMIDSLEMLRDTIEKQNVCSELNLNAGDYGLVTLHRPSNVDDPQILKRLCKELVGIAKQVPLVFPIHPRTRKNIENLELMVDLEKDKQLIISEPLNYIKFMNLVFNCRFALTDSGGIQEETTYLGIPCLTLRPNTERPITIDQGTNKLCDLDNLAENVREALTQKKSDVPRIEFWDGRTAERVVKSIKSLLS
ncbi:UDP-N-acetylglucosamine 2-epimerase (EC [Olavius sp. associated proteobacterium Delta 1]|nr:UDP-N-acetylglucosamine 2-epimerase (EC [Olavius sp. associated proteobacterium Delta 1]